MRRHNVTIRLIGKIGSLQAELPALEKQSQAVASTPMTRTRIGRTEELSEECRLVVADQFEEQIVQREGENVSERDVKSRR